LSVSNQFFYWIVKKQIKRAKINGYEEINTYHNETENEKKIVMTYNNVTYYMWYVIKPITFFFQNSLSYMLMLVIMNYNLGTFFSIVLGSVLVFLL
jgi:hypothetical protein